MQFLSELQYVSQKVEQVSVPKEIREEIKILSRYLMNQVMCDSDRRDKQPNISEAVERYVKKLGEAAFHTAFNQSSNFWNNLERLAGRTTSIPRSLTIVPPTGSDKWDIGELFQFLIEEVNKVPKDPEINKCLIALHKLYGDSKKPRYSRDLKKNEKLWRNEAHPVVHRLGLLDSLKNNLVLKSRLNIYLVGKI